MKKTMVLSVILLAFALAMVGYYHFGHSNKPSMVVEPMKDGKGIFVGDKRPQYQQSDPRKWSPETRKSVEEYEANVRAIDESWNNIAIGDNHFKLGQYQDALVAFEKAYRADPGSRTFVGYKLIETYEKLGRYDDALALLNDMITPKWSEQGLQKVNAIRARLLAAKNQLTPKSQ